MLLYADYVSLVIQDYQIKRAKNALHSGLTDPTPARLRDACLEVCNERFEARDERTLREFFGQGNDKATCLKAIDRLDPSKLKPLAKFIKEGTLYTSRKNVELLAWLIDFRPRPFIFNEIPDPVTTIANKNAPLEGRSVEVGDGPEVEEDGKILPNPEPPKHPARKFNTRMAVLLALLLGLTGIGIYWSGKNRSPMYTPIGIQGCMFWDGDHYEPIPCQQHGDTLVVPLDSEKLVGFRKIMRSDTITTNAIGVVWYVRYRNNYEFYTAAGFHPIDPNLRLRPITAYIIKNHIPPKP